jgi:hypothetical protein
MKQVVLDDAVIVTTLAFAFASVIAMWFFLT